ncbi:glutaredoxin family protein [Dokdonella sp.]|uniref:glutaredoxin family protein n=1 Tax=Dokdonella sp. TaxID=2291710 RepID=UPI001B152CBF|nr:glutaredoxin family protein [Dokdonella sp.]MBO9662135.1 glutaredoxin family protein [Dokdonella sp.]
MVKRMLRVVALAVFGLAAVGSGLAIAASKSPAGEPKIVMYATQTCGYCAKAREYFKAHGVTWDERDIETSAQAEQEWKALNGQGTPLILIGEEKVSGFHQARLDTLLAKYGK